MENKTPVRKRPYPVYKDSGVGWFKIPEHWEMKKLKLVSAINPEVLSEDTSPDYLMQYLDISNVDEISGIGRSQEMNFENAPGRARRIVRDGDTIVSTVRTYLKAVAYFENPPTNQVVSTGFAVIRPRECVFPKYLKWLILSPEFIERVVIHSEGVGYPSISPSKLTGLLISIPPLSEQRAIADYLDRETARIDALIAKYQRLIELLEEKRTTLINEVITRGLHSSGQLTASNLPWVKEIPSHWSIVKNGYLFEERDERGCPDLPLLNVSIHTGVTQREFSTEHIEQMASDWSTYKVARRGDIAYNKMRMWQGAVGVVPIDGLVSPDYTVACPRENVNSRYFEYLFRIDSYKNEINRFSHGIVPDRNRLYWDQFKQMPSLCPPYEEQNELAKYLDEESARSNQLIEKINQMMNKLQEYRTSLISAAVTGKIDVRSAGGK